MKYVNELSFLGLRVCETYMEPMKSDPCNAFKNAAKVNLMKLLKQLKYGESLI